MSKRRDLREAASGPLASRLSAKYLEQHCLLPLEIEPDGALATAVGAPLDSSVVDELSRFFGRELRLIQTPASEVLAAIMSARRESVQAPGNGRAKPTPKSPEALDDIEALANQAPVVKTVNVILLDALRMDASDVHLESEANGLRVRYRIDGVLQDVSRLPLDQRSAVVSRVKILAGLNIAERRLAQDGRARIPLLDRDVDVRVSTLPALHGESVVLRILDRAAHGRDLHELGMPPEILPAFQSLVSRPSGLILVTGPTGSGKTTTLYSALATVNSNGVKVVTIEDPVEYQIAGVVQIPVNPKAGFDFPIALRSILRHDPDVIMVGEMRDPATAAIAVQAALTGHMVFSTLHTSDSAAAVTRLIDMQIEPYLVAATISGIVAQRLIRLLCDSCAEEYQPDALELSAGGTSVTGRYRRSRGCEICGLTGYKGRTGIYELLIVDEAFQREVARGATISQLRSLARSSGMKTLSECGWDLVRAGRTSIAELMRVVDEPAVGT